MPSRREFLQITTLSLSALCLSSWRTGSTPRGADLSFALFFAEDRLPAMRRHFAENPLFAPLRSRLAAFDRAKERLFLEKEVRYNDHLYHIARLADSAQQLAFYYLMTGDKEAARLSADCIRTIMRFPKWDYFLEAGKEVIGIQRASSSVIATALCADWLGKTVSPQERAEWLATMSERGCEPCFRSLYGMRYPERVVGWSMDSTSTYFEHRPGDRFDLRNWPHILDKTNLKAVPAAALAIGAVACQQLFGRSADSGRWLEQAIFSLRSFAENFRSDGSYTEGVSYANYAALHLVQATTVLQRFQIVDLTDMINWPGYIDYAFGMAMPVQDDPYEIVNFGDNGNPKSSVAGKPKRSAVPMWVAAEFHDRRALWFAENLGGEVDEWSLAWHAAELSAEAPPAGPQLWRSDLDWIVARTGYAPADLVVAMRSGGPLNHEHADRNSLIVKCFGETLVADPLYPPYSFSDPSWMMRTTLGHSALLIDGKPHQYHDGSQGTNASEAVARLVRKGERAGYFYWTSEATQAYQLVIPEVQSVTRTVVVLHQLPAVLIFDKVTKAVQPATIQARFFAYNLDGKGSVNATADGFVTRRPLARLLAVTASDQGVRTAVGRLPIPAEVAAKHPFAEVATQTSSLAPFLVTVLLPATAEGAVPIVRITREGVGIFLIRLTQNDRMLSCRVYDSDTIPEFEIQG